MIAAIEKKSSPEVCLELSEPAPHQVSFPAWRGPWQLRAPMRVAGKPSHDGKQTETCKILLVEDDAAVAELYATVLRLDGYMVTIAVDGLAGLEAIRSRSYNIILLDIRMPRMDGLAMLRAAVDEPGADGTAVLILTCGTVVQLTRGRT